MAKFASMGVELGLQSYFLYNSAKTLYENSLRLSQIENQNVIANNDVANPKNDVPSTPPPPTDQNGINNNIET